MEIKKEILDLANKAEIELDSIYKKIDEICLYNSNRILEQFIKNKVNYSDFADINGYGNYDKGRDKLEAIFASVLGCEDALVRPQIMSGTTALYLTLKAMLKANDTMISISGLPYDSILETIGLEGNSNQSLIKCGVKYEQIDLLNNDFDYQAISTRLAKNDVKLVEIQRSRGYSERLSLSIAKIEKVIKEIRKVNDNVIIMVDNCYGELVEKLEPGHVKANLVVGSLMKNLGGGVASTGAYIAGDKDLINEVAESFSAPGIGKDIGANFNQNINMFKGIFMAPSAVKSALKTAVLASYMLDKLGYNDVSPKYDEVRTDIIQTVLLNSKDELEKFCQGVQESSPIDSYVKVMAAPMPGYPYDEVMASGSFTQGSTIELSCDAPVVSPFRLYMQGGLTYEYGKLGILLALSKLK